MVAVVLALSCLGCSVAAQNPDLSRLVRQYVRLDAPEVMLAHVRVIDGTGAPALEDQNVTIEGGKISTIEKGADVMWLPTWAQQLSTYAVIR